LLAQNIFYQLKQARSSIDIGQNELKIYYDRKTIMDMCIYIIYYILNVYSNLNKYYKIAFC